MAALNPFFKVFQIHGSNHRLMLLRPILIIVRKVSRLGIVSLIETKHHLVFVKATVLIVLVNNKYLTTIPFVNIIRKEHIYMISVHTFRTTNIAIGVLHSRFPFVTLRIYSITDRTFRVFNGNIECAYLHMTFLVIAGFFLLLRRSSIGFFLCHCNSIG